MKKGTMLNSDLCRIIARMGHTDQIVIGDAGLPIPDSTERLDLALVAGIPSFMQVVEAVTEEMCIEKVMIANEIITANPDVYNQLINHLQSVIQQQQGKPITIEYITHEELKRQSASSRAVVRTGECSPYANIILCSGVIF